MTGVDADLVVRAEPDPVLGLILRGLRRGSGQGLRELAGASGVDESTLAQIEAGTFDPTWPMMEDIARGLGTSLERVAGAVVDMESGLQSPRSQPTPTPPGRFPKPS